MNAFNRILAVLAISASSLTVTHSAEPPARPPLAPNAVDTPAAIPPLVKKELIRGTHVRLARPEGFGNGERFTGFQEDKTGASVVVLEFDGPYSEFAKGMNAEGLATQNITLEWRKEIKIGGRAGLLMAGRQDAGEIKFEKWMLIYGDNNRTFFITANYPAAHSRDLSPRMYSCVLSAEVDETGGYDPRDPFADLRFRVTPIAPWRFASRAMDNLIFTQSGSIPKPPNSDQGMFTVGSSVNELHLTDRKHFAEWRMHRSKIAEKLAIKSIQPIDVDGLSGYEIVGSGTDEGTGTPLCVYQTVLFESNGGYYGLMIGAISAHKSDQALKEFKSIARTFKQQAIR